MHVEISIETSKDTVATVKGKTLNQRHECGKTLFDRDEQLIGYTLSARIRSDVEIKKIPLTATAHLAKLNKLHNKANISLRSM